MAQKQAVSLYVFTELPETGLVAVLQRRGEFNHEKMGPESYPGGFQPLAHGGIQVGESVAGALFREAEEELGASFRQWVLRNKPEVYKAIFGCFDENLQRGVDEGKVGFLREVNDFICINAFVIKLPMEFLRHLSLGPQTGGIRFVNQEQALRGILNLREFSREEGVSRREVTAMFPDDISALNRAFAVVQHMHVR